MQVAKSKGRQSKVLSHGPYCCLSKNSTFKLIIFTMSFLILLCFYSMGIYEISNARNPILNSGDDYLLGVCVALLLHLAIEFIPISSKLKPTLHLIWFGRTLFALFFGIFYESNYIFLDAFTYFESAIIDPVSIDKISFAGTSNILVFSSFFVNANIVSYHAIKIIFAFLGFLGLVGYYLTWETITGRKSAQCLLIFGLFPSFAFWSSIYGKDSIVVFTLGFYFLFFSKCLVSKRSQFWKFFLFSILFLIGASMVRSWLFWIFGPLSFLSIIKTKAKTSWFTCSMILLPTTPILTYFIFSPDLNSLLERINTISRSWAIGGSGQIPPTFHSISDILLFLPLGMFTALFRPQLTDINNMFSLFAAIENVILIIGIFIAFSKRLNNDYNLIFFRRIFINFLILWSMVYSFISYQNLGAASRFRCQITGLLLIVITLSSSFVRKPAPLVSNE